MHASGSVQGYFLLRILSWVLWNTMVRHLTSSYSLLTQWTCSGVLTSLKRRTNRQIIPWELILTTLLRYNLDKVFFLPDYTLFRFRVFSRAPVLFHAVSRPGAQSTQNSSKPHFRGLSRHSYRMKLSICRWTQAKKFRSKASSRCKYKLLWDSSFFLFLSRGHTTSASDDSNTV